MTTKFEKRKVMKELVAETVAFYAADPVNRRSLRSDTELTACAYHGPAGLCCAFSRVCVPGTDLTEYDHSPANASEVLNTEGEETLLPEKYWGFSVRFWDKLQQLHDCNMHWNDYGLTPAGLQMAGQLITGIIGGKYDRRDGELTD